MTEQGEQGLLEKKNLGPRHLFFLLFISFILTNLVFFGLSGIGQYFGIFSLLAPVPLTFAFLIYGRRQTLGLCLGIMACLVLGSFLVPSMGLMAVAYFFTTFHAFLVVAVIENKISPIKGVLAIGTLLVTILWMIIMGYHFVIEGGILHHLNEVIELSLKQLPDQKVDSKALVNHIQTMGPIYITVTPYLALWVCFLLVMKNAQFWNHRVKYPHSMEDLVSFRAPEYLVYPLLAGLGLGLMGNHYDVFSMALISSLILSLVGVFYFFQGLGLFLDSLNHFKITGFMRSFLVLFVILFAQIWLAVLGVFDSWFDLRKFFRKKLNGGDAR